MTEDMNTFENRVRRFDPEFRPSKFHQWWNKPRRKKHIPLLKTFVVCVVLYGALTTAKVVMEQELGAQGFDVRVAELSKGSDSQKIAAALLFRDPVMAYVNADL